MIENIRKAGLFTKGAVYSLVGILTLMAAFNLGGKTAGKNGIVEFLQNQIFGKILVIIMGIGLAAYAIWRIYSAFLDAKNEGSDKTGYTKRIGYFISGLAYGALGISILLSSIGQGQSNDSQVKEQMASTLLDQNYGGILLYAIAAILLSIGIYQLAKGYRQKFLEEIDQTGQIESKEILKKSGMIGFIARGISFLIFAWFAFQAAYQNNADAVRGLEGVFAFLNDMPLGNILMALLALGFIGYGVYQYFLARYSRIYD